MLSSKGLTKSYDSLQILKGIVDKSSPNIIYK